MPRANRDSTHCSSLCAGHHHRLARIAASRAQSGVFRRNRDLGEPMPAKPQHTRSAVMLLREFLDDKRRHEQRDEADEYDVGSSVSPDEAASQDTRSKNARLEDPTRLKRVIVRVRHDKRWVHLILSRRPSAEGRAWLQYVDDGQEAEVSLAQVRPVALLEG